MATKIIAAGAEVYRKLPGRQRESECGEAEAEKFESVARANRKSAEWDVEKP